MSNNDCTVLVKGFPENRSAAHAGKTTLLAYEVHSKVMFVYDACVNNACVGRVRRRFRSKFQDFNRVT